MRRLISRFWTWFHRPSVQFGQGILLVTGLVAGIVFWGGFNTALEATNTTEFCISCHEMRETVYQEYQASLHFKNASGVRATCADCHVPHALGPKLARKFWASNDLLQHLLGTVDTPEKFEAKRLELAMRVWTAMKATDSRECRSCHGFDAMAFEHQRPRSREKMEPVATGTNLSEGSTCIDCHKGIAHKLPVVERDD